MPLAATSKLHAPIAIAGPATIRGSREIDTIPGAITAMMMTMKKRRELYMQIMLDRSTFISLISAVCLFIQRSSCQSAWWEGSEKVKRSMPFYCTCSRDA